MPFLQELVRGGITVNANLDYRLTPGLRIAVCYIKLPITIENCVTIHDELPDNRIVIDTWYQFRSLKFCKHGWVHYVSLYMCICNKTFSLKLFCGPLGASLARVYQSILWRGTIL